MVDSVVMNIRLCFVVVVVVAAATAVVSGREYYWDGSLYRTAVDGVQITIY
jgi:hypothetical protein